VAPVDARVEHRHAHVRAVETRFAERRMSAPTSGLTSSSAESGMNGSSSMRATRFASRWTKSI
jgi:hypothetical protein